MLSRQQRQLIQNKYKHQDRLQSLCGLMLVKHGLHMLGFKNFAISNIDYQPDGKPITTYPVHFNISHSENLVVCVLSKRQAVAIDVEKNRLLSSQLVNRYLKNKSATTSELQAWIAKEAFIKLFDNTSMKDMPHISLTSTSAHLDRLSCYIKYVKLINGYNCAIASQTKARYVHTQKVRLN